MSQSRKADEGRRSFCAFAGAFTGGLAAAFTAGGLVGVATFVEGCGGSSSHGGGIPPAGSGSGGSGSGGGTQTITLRAHLDSEYGISATPKPLGEVITLVKDKSTGGVLASGDLAAAEGIMVFVFQNGVWVPVREAAELITVQTGDKIQIGQTVKSGQVYADELEDYVFITGPFETTVA